MLPQGEKCSLDVLEIDDNGKGYRSISIPRAAPAWERASRAIAWSPSEGQFELTLEEQTVGMRIRLAAPVGRLS